MNSSFSCVSARHCGVSGTAAVGGVLRRLMPSGTTSHLLRHGRSAALAFRYGGDVAKTCCARKVPWVVHWHSDVVVSNIKWSVALAYMLYRPFEQALLERALGSVKAHSAELLGMCRCSMSGFTRSKALPRACRKPSAMGA